jgi:hypothetical protein
VPRTTQSRSASQQQPVPAQRAQRRQLLPLVRAASPAQGATVPPAPHSARQSAHQRQPHSGALPVPQIPSPRLAGAWRTHRTRYTATYLPRDARPRTAPPGDAPRDGRQPSSIRWAVRGAGALGRCAAHRMAQQQKRQQGARAACAGCGIQTRKPASQHPAHSAPAPLHGTCACCGARALRCCCWARASNAPSHAHASSLVAACHAIGAWHGETTTRYHRASATIGYSSRHPSPLRQRLRR